MTACSNPPKRLPDDQLEHLIDGVAWAKTCMIIAAATSPNSDERRAELEKLRQAIVEPRRLVDDAMSKHYDMPYEVMVELRACELAIPKLEAGAVLRSK